MKQKINGKTWIRMTNSYFEEYGEYICKYPREICLEYWERLCTDTEECDIMYFIRMLCRTHSTIKEFTKGQVDFCEVIGEELGKV